MSGSRPKLANQTRIHPVELKDIKGIGPKAKELLEAAGYGDIQSLAQAEPAALVAELAKANALLHVARQNIPSDKVQGWVAEARALLAPPDPASDAPVPVPDGQQAVDYEQSPEVQAMLANAPFALPLPAKVLMEHRVSVSQIPSGIMLNHYVGDLEVRVGPSTGQPAPAPRSANGYAMMPQRGQTSGNGEGRHDLVRTAREETNRGKDPNSRWYVRGVLHSSPIALYIAACISLLTVFLVPCAIIAAVLLVLSREVGEPFAWVPGWFLAIPTSLLVLGPAYLIWGLAGRCRICNQRLFVHRSRHHNSKAHHLPVLGYVLPLCCHLLVFKWFRCTHCGTSIRVKE